MRTERILLALCCASVVGGPGALPVSAAERTPLNPSQSRTVAISRDADTGQIRIAWRGREALRAAGHPAGPFREVRPLKRIRREGQFHEVTVPAEKGLHLFRVETLGEAAPASVGKNIYSINVVGYINMDLQPGYTLASVQLLHTNAAVAYWLPQAPDGAQVFTYMEPNGYEVSTFDGMRGCWSRPDLAIPMGTGFLFRNPSSNAWPFTVVGEVMQGELVNPLPAGYSTKGALVPQEGSVNTVHLLPGEPGDRMYLYVKNGPGGGGFVSALFTAPPQAWVPDLTLKVGEGFWIWKQRAQDWIRTFYVN